MGKQCFILRYEMLILFCVFSALNTASHTEANASIAGDSQTNFDLSLPVETNRTRRSIIGALGIVISAVGVGTSLIDFTVTNIEKTFDKGVAGKELSPISHFKKIQDELEAQNQELQSINLSVAYAEHEKNIKDSLLELQQYLEHPIDHYRNVFIDKGKYLKGDINNLVDGLLHQHALSPDIMVAIRNATKCHGQKMRKNVQHIFSIIMTGLWVHGEYQRIIEIAEGNRSPSSSHFKESIVASQMKLTKRLDNMLIECQADEGNVSHEMRQILEATPGRSKKSVADSLLEFLENKYDTKRWLVVLLSGNDDNFQQYWIAGSKGFHKTPYQKDLAVAVSVDGKGDFSATINSMESHFKEFEIPYWYNPSCIEHGGYRMYMYGASVGNTISKYDREYFSFKTKFEIFNHLYQFWVPMLTTNSLDVELLSVDQYRFENGIAVASKGAQYVRLHPSSNCFATLVLVIPRIPIVPKSACSYNPVRVQKSGRLRNLDGQGYLSVKDDSSQEGAYVILEQESRRSPGQTWKFVNNQLRNGFGKCLTAWTPNSWYLYQYDCHHNWPGQKWTRQGLHIYNGYNYYLDGSSRNRYAIQNYGRPWSSLIWQNLDTDC